MSKIRIVVQESDAGMAANVGGPVTTIYRTFDVDAPDLVAVMSASCHSYKTRSIVGVEILPTDDIHVPVNP